MIGRLSRGGPHRLVVMVGLASFVIGAYVVVVLGGGAIIGRTDSPSLLLSVVATAAVALLFAPVQAALERVATRMGLRRSATPYDVLSRFSGLSWATTRLRNYRPGCRCCWPRGPGRSGRRYG